MPVAFALEGNYPNPFNPSTTIRYALPRPAAVHLSVYDVQGRLVEVLVERQQSPGRYEVVFETDNLASGGYVYRLAAGDVVQTRRMVLLK